MQTKHGRDAVQPARRTYALVPAGGRGSRLMQLTERWATPHASAAPIPVSC